MFEKRNITVYYMDNGHHTPLTVNAECYKGLAVHKTIKNGEESKGYTITHIRSGFACARNINMQRSIAKEVALRMADYTDYTIEIDKDNYR